MTGNQHWGAEEEINQRFWKNSVTCYLKMVECLGRKLLEEFGENKNLSPQSFH